jgi:hypothetical protein
MSQVTLQSPKEISAALSVSLEHGGAVVTEQDLSPDFFNLRTGFAGELLQKFVNYRARLAIVLPDPPAQRLSVCSRVPMARLGSLCLECVFNQ